MIQKHIPLRPAILAAAVLLAPQGAAAEGLYVRALGGLSLLQDDTARLGTASRTDARYDGSFATGAALGYALTDNIAAEVEFMYRTADLGSFDIPTLGRSGDFASAILSAHAVYTFDGWYTGADSTCRPFIGLGLGVVEEVDFDLAGGTIAQAYQSSGDLVWQVRAGADWAFAENWSLTGEVRYLDMGTPSLEAKTSGPDLKAGYSTVDVLLGLTYRF